MKRTTIALAALIAGTGLATAEVTAPGDVSFDGYEVAESLTGTPGNPEAGREVVVDKGAGNCIACHAAEAYADVPFGGEVGPMLDGAGDRWSESELRGILVNAKMAFDGTVMPAFYKTEGFTRLGDAFTGKAWPADKPVEPLLTAQQIEDVVAYLMTLHE
ncbi:sulfur oxidation c-type cytochrome SoxX [Maritimibacter sp. DP1N21-5]|uniref:sulfur oxidation c-type cytochrome SoxX n=1 Tax=Maritimibacter sp. DP1N21-5 TaxID=2836867 RepID=UPI001C4694C5|nr:sulfur oxidation c-type cytochrome SoxX [Maritimibacter sp. DP1N21-5]MBV7409591.1 sulfur oxidation c-type cytochrome SoxX [Maritimibacter sp. DP1N21-5]